MKAATKKPINPRQEKFCQLYVTTGNATKSYEGAGYSTKGHASGVMAEKLLRKADIQNRISEIQGEASKQASLSRAQIVEYLVEVIETPLSKVTTKSRLCQSYEKKTGKLTVVGKLGAIDKLCRILGYYEPIKVDVGIEAKLLALFADVTGVKKS